MNDRFIPDPRKIRKLIGKLVELTGIEQALLEAFRACASSDLEATTKDDVSRNLEFVAGTRNEQIPWLFFDTIYEFIGRLPGPIQERIAREFWIETNYPYEQLRITADGRWQVAWVLDPSAGNDGKIALDWYRPTDHDTVPIVPIPTIDYVAGCVSLCRNGLVLPAAAIICVVLESALWEALTNKGIKRVSIREKFKPVSWRLKRKHDKLLLMIEGADKIIGQELDQVLGESPPEFKVGIRLLQKSDDSDEVSVQINVDSLLAGFLFSSEVDSREDIANSGFSVAMQRARKERIQSLNTTIIPALDNTLKELRNNLVHLPSQHDLIPPVPVPGEGQYSTFEQLRNHPEFIRNLLSWITAFVNEVYSGRIDQVETSE